MAVRIQFDSNHTAIRPTFVVATRSGDKLGYIPTAELHVHDIFSATGQAAEVSFDVYKYDGEVRYTHWEEIKNLRLCWCKEWDQWYEMQVDTQDERAIVKHVTCTALGEAELSQTMIYGLEINTENDIARDDYNHYGLPDETHALWDDRFMHNSILYRLMSKVPHYSIDHVDATIAKEQRTFSFNGMSVYDCLQEIALEYECVVFVHANSNPDGSIHRGISLYDLQNTCQSCGERGEFLHVCSKCGSSNIKRGYGEDTTVFVNTENLAENISLTTDLGEVKNCFKLSGGDDLMTAAIVSCLPTGTPYIWMFTEETKNDFTPALKSRFEQYQRDYEYYNNTYPTYIDASLVSNYNSHIMKYRQYDGKLEAIQNPIVGYSRLMKIYYDVIDFELYLEHSLMPTRKMSSTSAYSQSLKINNSDSSMKKVAVNIINIDYCTVSTADGAALSVAKSLVDPRYSVELESSTYDEGTHKWSGTFKIKNYSDETDSTTRSVSNVEIISDKDLYTRQLMKRALKDKISSATEETASDIVELCELSRTSFRRALKNYSQACLKEFSMLIQTCLDVMTEQGVTDGSSWDAEIYPHLYEPYHTKLCDIQDELAIRDHEVMTITGVVDANGKIIRPGLKTVIEEKLDYIQKQLEMKPYFGEQLYNELLAFRREDEYTNSNYISDGLSNHELFARAKRFLELAERDLFKSAHIQHTIDSTMQNLLAMEEFKPIVDYFTVGNWIRIEIDEQLFMLRLVSYDINFEDLSEFSVTFSDAKLLTNGISDLESLLKGASGMATSFTSVQRQVAKVADTAGQVDDWFTNGLDVSKSLVTDQSNNCCVTWDANGILCRDYSPTTDSYSDCQLKILTNGMYLTTDNWLTIRAAIGKFYYYDPFDEMTLKEGYGINGETIVGRLILGQELGIYNAEANMAFNEDGLLIRNTSGSIEVAINPNDPDVISIKNNTETVLGFTTDVEDGETRLYIRGMIEADKGQIGGWSIGKSKIYAGDAVTGTVALRRPQAGRSTIVFAAGGKSHDDYHDCPFIIRSTGDFEAKKGSIANWKIATDKLYGGREGDGSCTMVGIATREGGAVFAAGGYTFETQDTYRFKVTKRGQCFTSDGMVHTSDAKMKDIIGDIGFAKDFIMNLEPKTYMWKMGDHRRTRMGFVAQDVARICKDMNRNLAVVTASYKGEVDGAYYGEETDDTKLTWGITYDEIIAPLVKVVQDQQREIEILKERINGDNEWQLAADERRAEQVREQETSAEDIIRDSSQPDDSGEGDERVQQSTGKDY